MADNIDAQALIDRLSEVEDQFGLVNGSLVSFLRSVKKNTADFDKEIKKLNKGIERGTKGFQDQLYVLQQLNDAIEELSFAISLCISFYNNEKIFSKMRKKVQNAIIVN